MRRIFLLVILLSCVCATMAAQDAVMVRRCLTDAAIKYDIPAPVLYAIAFTESHWENSSDGDASCTGMPKAHGIMGLRDDAYFGTSLHDGDAIGITVHMADTGIVENIAVGAYRLSMLFHGSNRQSIADWYDAIKNYPGIPKEVFRRLYLDGVIELLKNGWVSGCEIIAPIDIPSIDKQQLQNDLEAAGVISTAPDYATAVWMPSPNYSPRAGTPITHITIHDTEGNFAGSVAWLSDTVAQASAHYIIRGVDGYVVQLVREADKAWHVRTENPYTIGIEHEGYVSKPASFTPALYQSSAKLVRYLIDKYQVPLDRVHVKGHLDFPNNSHTDPGGWWNWPAYFRQVRGDPSLRVVLDPFEDNVVGWWQPDQSGSTNGVDTAGTHFNVHASAARSGESGSTLSYKFSNNTDGVVRTFRSGHGNSTDGLLFVGNSGFVTLDVKGDASGHALEMWFYDSTKANFIAPVGKLDWMGWRTVAVDLSTIGASTGLRFNSLALRQVAGGKRMGEIDVDNLAHTVERPVSGVDDRRQQVRSSIRIENDIAHIMFAATVVDASIDFTNVLGSLCKRATVTGRHDELSIDVSDLPHGLYFVTVRTAKDQLHYRFIR